MRFALAWSSLRRHTTRTLLATLGVAVAAAMLLDMAMMSTGMRESFRELLLSRGFQLRLAPKGTLPFDTDATIRNTSGILTILRSNPEITTVSPVLGGTIQVPIGNRVVTSAALGINPAVQGDYELLSGKDPSSADDFVGNDEFMTATGSHIGDTLEVASGYDPELRTYAASRKMVLTGRVRFLYGAADQLATAMKLATLQQLSGPQHADDVSLFMIKVRNDAEVEGVRRWTER
ncbi:MAG: ABC transporter permease, partial [Thermoanaerobaculia bacterium]